MDWTTSPLTGAYRLVVARPRLWLTIVLPATILSVVWSFSATRSVPLPNISPVQGIPLAPSGILDDLAHGSTADLVTTSVLTVLVWLVWQATFAVLLVAQQHELDERAPTLADVLSPGLKRTPAIVVLGVLLTVVLWVYQLPITVLQLLSRGSDPVLSPASSLRFAAPLSLVLPWVATYFAARFALSPPAVVVGFQGGWQGLVESWRLSRSRVLPLVLYTLFLAIPNFVAMLPWLIFAGAFRNTSAQVPEPSLIVWSTVSTVLVGIYDSALFLLLWHKYGSPSPPPSEPPHVPREHGARERHERKRRLRR